MRRSQPKQPQGAQEKEGVPWSGGDGVDHRQQQRDREPCQHGLDDSEADDQDQQNKNPAHGPPPSSGQK
jgi:hypothetical protein